MTDRELETLLRTVQKFADEKAQHFTFKRTAKLDIIHAENLENGDVEVYCLGADMPKLIYRIFTVHTDGTVTEQSDPRNASEKTAHFNRDILPGLKFVPTSTNENDLYEIIVENKIENNGVEVKLKSSNGRNVTMVEVYRYYDSASKIFYVACVSVSFGGQYLFALAPDGKHLRLLVINPNDEYLKDRINKLSELLAARKLPSYQTIEAGSQLLGSKDARANVTLNGNDGTKREFVVNFCYDDQETLTRFAFLGRVFPKDVDPNTLPDEDKKGLILVNDLVTHSFVLPNNWTEAQKTAIERILKEMQDNNEEFKKHVANFFSDNLDIRYAAFKAEAAAPKAEEPAPEAK